MIFVNAAHWFIPKRTIEEVGGFNPYFFQGVEDHEYANRVKFKNKKIEKHLQLNWMKFLLQKTNQSGWRF